MSELRSAIDELKSLPHQELSLADRHEAMLEMVHADDQLIVAMAGLIRTLHTHELRELGYSSPTAYLMDIGCMSAGHAKRVVSMANAVAKAPLAYQAWADGRLSVDQASLVFRAAEGVPDSYPEAERNLIEIVEPLSVSDTGKVIEYWRQSVDGPGDTDLETQLQRRGLSLSKSHGGMRRVDGWLTTQAGEALETALQSLTPPPRDGDFRTPRQKRHDALEDLTRHWLDHGDTPQLGGEKPHITLLTDLDALKGIAGGTHETINGDVVDVETIRQTSCDASISRIVIGPDSEILDIGRKTRVWTTAQRRAIIARDRHCTHPGCETRPGYCDIHHIEHWADGGTTSVDKGRLLCRFHHTSEHLGHARRRRRTRG